MGILCRVIAPLILVFMLTSHIDVICYAFVLILAIDLIYLLYDEYRRGIVTSYCDIINKLLSILHVLCMCTLAIITIQPYILDEQFDGGLFSDNFSSYIENQSLNDFESIYKNTIENSSDEIYFYYSIESSNPNEYESDPSGGDSNPSGGDSNPGGEGSNPSGEDSNFNEEGSSKGKGKAKAYYYEYENSNPEYDKFNHEQGSGNKSYNDYSEYESGKGKARASEPNNFNPEQTSGNIPSSNDFSESYNDFSESSNRFSDSEMNKTRLNSLKEIGGESSKQGGESSKQGGESSKQGGESSKQ
ncbi:hypothetical protein K491DRAFT_743626 [Lophiostoma macrostomum CBS 122681]|uniref:Uncharacterized protein n=1 Tax=Lophiostoma macrostomum CBS 122681 TaxID=1314788 RepID=A0A6A6SJ88_9PLEO|nr:hypothetical protein K491DRAFT_743626 [Lophiostoma macrostomum CBS 122681]